MDKLVNISVIKAYSLIGISTSRLRPLGILSTALLKFLIILPLKLILIGFIRREVLTALQN
jgi:hypothetical protein